MNFDILSKLFLICSQYCRYILLGIITYKLFLILGLKDDAIGVSLH